MLVKICGIKDVTGLKAAREAGADMVGFVFFPPSPRAVTPAEAGLLVRSYAGGPKRVGLFVDPDDATLAATLAEVPLDILQLQGEESPARAGEMGWGGRGSRREILPPAHSKIEGHPCGF